MNHRHHVAVFFGTMILVLATITACSDTATPPSLVEPNPETNSPETNSVVADVAPGQSEFENEVPVGSDGFIGDRSRNTAFGSPSALESSSAGAEDQSAKGSAPPSGRDGAVEEADIYRVENNHLFYLNTYRGFIIYDVNDPKLPRRVSRLPVYGHPVEMFVEKNTVYALLRDVLYLEEHAGELRFERRHVSQLITIDISDLDHPRVLKRIDIAGELREGVSRKIEDTIYVVSTIRPHYFRGWAQNQVGTPTKSQAWVYSFNVQAPKSPALVRKMKIFEGPGDTTAPDLEASPADETTGGNSEEVSADAPPSTRTQTNHFAGLVISATSNALMVVENWNRTVSAANTTDSCGLAIHEKHARISLIDISDPEGRIKVHARFETSGHLSDQFKQTYSFDARANKGTYIGIFARNDWRFDACESERIVQNRIESWDVSDGGNPRRLSKLTFGKPNETVRGSAFDPTRNIAFAITAEAIDPLYAISYADPANLRILSEIDGLSGDMNVFRLVANGRFLLGIGRDNSKACTGIADPNGPRLPTQIAVSLIDVRNLAAIRLLQRKCVAVENAEWINSAVNWNRDQAHKMIGMHSDDRHNIITVPISYYHQGGGTYGWHEWKTAVGLMSWDTPEGDRTQGDQADELLQNFGTVIHPHGEVKRSIVFTHEGERDRRMMFNLSDTHISVVDIEDLAHPKVQSVVEVAPFQQSIFRFDQYIVEQVGGVNHHGYADSGRKTEFRVKRAGGKLESAPVVARFDVGQIQRVIKQGDNLVIFRYSHAEKSRRPGPSTQLEAIVYDLADPTAPRLAGRAQMPGLFAPTYRFYCGSGGYGAGYEFYDRTWTSTQRGIAFLKRDYALTGREGEFRLIFLDLHDAQNPVLRTHKFPHLDNRSYLGLVADALDPAGFYLNYTTGNPIPSSASDKPERALIKHFAQRIFVTDNKIALSQPINLPGRLVRTLSIGRDPQKYYLAQDQGYRPVVRPANSGDEVQWAVTNRVHLLRAIRRNSQDLASLVDSAGFGKLTLSDLVLNGQQLAVKGTLGWSYRYGNTIDDGIEPGIGRPGVAQAADQSEEAGASEPLDLSDRLILFDLSKSRLDRVYDQSLGTFNVSLMGSYRGRLFINLPGDGILSINTDDPTRPFGQSFLRTRGYATHIEFAGRRAYIAAGYFGVYELDLDQSVTIPQI